MRDRAALIGLAAGALLLLVLSLLAWRESAALAPTAEPDAAAAATALALAHAELMSAAAIDPDSLLPRWEAFGEAVIRASTPPLRQVLFRLPTYPAALEGARGLLAGTEIAAEGAEPPAFAAAVRRLGAPLAGVLADLLRDAEAAAATEDELARSRFVRLKWLGAAASALVVVLACGVALLLWRRQHQAAAALADEVARRQALDGELAAERAAARDKADLLAAAGDDLRSPLNRVVGLLDEAGATAGQEAADRTLLAEAKRITHGAMTVAGDMADLARLEAGRLVTASEPFRPADVAQRVVHLMTPRAEERRVQIELIPAGDMAEWWLGDAARLRQILFAVMGAALRATEGGRLTLRLGGAPQGGLRCVVICSVPSSRMETGPPGLRQAAEIARLMGGTLLARPDAAGWTAMLDLPMAAADAPPVGAPSAARGGAVLVADASVTHRRVLAAMLERHGFTAAMEESGVAALLRARVQPHRAVFLAASLPDLSGGALARALRAEPGESRGAIIVLVADPGGAELRGAAEFDAVLRTPLSEQAVLSVLEAAPAGTGPDALPLLDAEALQLLAGSLSAGDARALLTTTLSEAAELAGRIRQGLSRGARQETAEHARALALAADVLGARRLRAQAERLAAEPALAVQLIDTLDRTLQQTRSALLPAGGTEGRHQPAA